MLKLGMQPEGIERESAVKGDRYESFAVYSILEDEWRAARGKRSASQDSGAA